MRINLKHRYRGTLTDERWLEQGEHDLDATLARYLVTNGHAVYVDVQPETMPEKEPTLLDELLADTPPEDMTKAEIMELLDAWGIEYTTRNTKAELIELLESCS